MLLQHDNLQKGSSKVHVQEHPWLMASSNVFHLFADLGVCHSHVGLKGNFAQELQRE